MIVENVQYVLIEIINSGAKPEYPLQKHADGQALAVVKGESTTPLPRAIEQTTAHGQASELNIKRSVAILKKGDAVLILSNSMHGITHINLISKNKWGKK
ncbi:MAG: hypothetical protein GY729_03900 [Desulfobacteraceae bacterium]|nr:hypothetical protein [Desulfobacteraceae bacterium]